jgi:hypothetical protein
MIARQVYREGKKGLHWQVPPACLVYGSEYCRYIKNYKKNTLEN